MSFKEYIHSSKPLFEELNILNVYQVNYFVTGNVMYQYSKNQLPPAICHCLKLMKKYTTITHGQVKSSISQKEQNKC